ncbi:terminase small subunit [Alteromonas gracilis]|uniref:terminase small subunit n=1 Tax=Alteromonas gracilis TaxID=1479524 RepID=UPI0030D3EBCC
MIVNLEQLADILGVSLPTLRTMVKKGMPYLEEGSKGVPWEFDSAVVIAWLLAKEREDNQPQPEDQDPNANTAKELQRRKLQAETEIVEIELAKKKGLVVLIEDAVACISDSVATVRAQLLNLPRRAAPLVVGETDEGTVKDTLEHEVDEILQELRKGAIGRADELTNSD